jgi:cobalt-zinc-cadmium efflux system outer membrane protein
VAKRFLALDVLAVTLMGMPTFGCVTFPIQGQPAEIDSVSRDAQRSADTLPVPHLLNDEPAPYSPPELLDELEEAPADGLSLDEAIDRLLSNNPDLAAQYQDIPKARADVLTAGLRSDPVVFFTASPIPYGRYSVQRPGATAYDITFVQPLDLSGKHKTNKRVAEKNIPILEAHYQDAVRLQIDRLFTAYVNVLEAQAEARAAHINLKRLAEAAEKCSEQVRQGRRRQSDGTRLSLRLARTRIAVRQAEASLLHARRNLSVLLALPADEADDLSLRGSLRDCSLPPPPISELIEMARHSRPDLRALTLSVDRARAEVRREKAEAVDDFFLFYSPYQALDLTPQGQQLANSWEIGVMIPFPVLNRNQGEIRRARVNVTQWRIEVERAEQEIIDEVRRAATEYEVSRQTVELYERDILADGRRRREETYRRFAEGDKDVAAFLSSQRDYDEMIRAYVEALARHRRAMLGLNTAVGQRILP